MRVLILGAAGMLGHKVWQTLTGTCEVYGTVRANVSRYDRTRLFDSGRILDQVDAASLQTLVEVFSRTRPEVVVNAIGIVKQRAAAKDVLPSLEINAALPHRLAALCSTCGSRLIQLSTDCVFSGARGGYTEDDQPDPSDVYGRTKLLGEVSYGPALTLRTSMIGRELETRQGLVEWFLSRAGGRVRGFRRAIFSGLTTLELARLIKRLALDFPDLNGLYHVASEPITKFDLLCLIRDIYKLDVAVDQDDEYACDRSLIGRRFHETTGYFAPPWREMIQQMHDDPTRYDDWRQEG